MIRSIAVVLTGMLLGLAVPAQAASGRQAEAAPPVREDGKFCKFYKVENPKVVTLLIDRTLPVTNAQDRKDAEAALDKALGMLEQGQRLRVATIRESVGSSQVLFDDCRPGVPQGAASFFSKPASSQDLRTDTPVFEAEAKAAVAAAVHEKNRLPQAPQSAIVATIADVGRMFRGQMVGLVLASDMIEGRLADLAPTPDATLDPRSRDKLLTKAAELDLVPRLEGVVVHSFKINHWDRKNRPVLADTTIRDLREFWIEYFRMTGATSAAIN
ncbi:MAG: hypothetical protein LDL39_11600 [Magnetospirillum sp.]|nr:hypothetical protein [Magnetospirillum sp.]